MAAQHPSVDPATEAVWREALLKGHPGRWSFLPSDPRCTFCAQPFHGIGGTLLRTFTGYGPSRMSPNVCNYCEEQLPIGGAEVDTAVLFADVRGSTELGEQLGPTQFANLLNRFYRATAEVLVREDGWIDKFVGDEIMGLYVPSMGADYRERAVQHGLLLLRAVGYGLEGEPWLPVGVGVHAGPAFVGKVGTAGATQVTALGDTGNTAARLQAVAAPGECVVSEELYASVATRYPEAEQRVMDLRGKDRAFGVRVIRP